MLPAAIDQLATVMRGFPGIGQRGALKIALDVLHLDPEKYLEFVEAVEKIRSVKMCQNCGFFAGEADPVSGLLLCEICKDVAGQRNSSQLCLVEKPTDVITVEKSQIYRGQYHVLNSLISPLDNIFPEDTTVMDLVERRLPELLSHQESVEIILFFKAGFAGQATTAYLNEVLNKHGIHNKVKITRLAQGLPLYYNPDTLDQATMVKALEDRREV